jgi:hypothetical protein
MSTDRDCPLRILDTLEPHSPALVHVPAASKRERDEDYDRVIVRLDDRDRVINCSDNLQWIIQRRRGDQWHGYSFHRCRDVMIERSSAKGESLAILKSLPEWHP